MLDIPPAPSPGHGSPAGTPLSSSMSEAVDIMPSSDEDSPGGWRLVDKDTLGTRRISRRRTTTERSGGGFHFFYCRRLESSDPVSHI